MPDTEIPESGPMSASELAGRINDRFANRFVDVALTQAAYDALPVKDANTRYSILEP